MLCLVISLYLCCFCNWSLSFSVRTHINTGLSDRNNNNNQHHHNHQGTCRKTMTNTKETKRQFTWPHKCCVTFHDVRGFKVPDVLSASLHHKNKSSHANLYGLLSVPSVVHQKAKRSALRWSNCSVHTQLTLSFRKVRHISIYVLLFNKAFVQ